jgi:NAD(P)-dependent dehydrogenase (short-subunit alcohol dehydrogenase family)
LVTGASKGIGRGIAYGLGADGWDVAVNYHQDQEGAEETAERVRGLGRRCWVLQADVAKQVDVERMFRELGGDAKNLRLLVNNAGRQTWSSLLDLKLDDWQRTIGTNLTGTFLCTQQAARLMKDTGGSIVNIGSASNKWPFPNLVDYTASKGGLENFTKVAAVELGPYQIRVNCVAPGAIEIERTKLEAPDYAATWAPLTPLGRIGQVEDVADAVVFFASDQAKFITGQTVYVDGGLFTKPQWPYQ